MPEYLAPGVFVEEVSSGNQPIEGVGTSTAAFVGLALKGPVNKAVLITNFTQYRNVFGDFHQDYLLPLAVQQFFFQGGKRCYVVRVYQKEKHAGNGEGVAVDDLHSGTRPVLRVKAGSPGHWGNRLFVQVAPPSFDPEDRDNESRRFMLNLYRSEANKTERIASFDRLSMDALDRDGLPNPCYVERKINGENPFIEVEVLDPGRAEPPDWWRRRLSFLLRSEDERETRLFELEAKPAKDGFGIRIGPPSNKTGDFDLMVFDKEDPDETTLETHASLSLKPGSARYPTAYFEQHPSEYFLIRRLPPPPPHGWRASEPVETAFEPTAQNKSFSLFQEEGGGVPVLDVEALETGGQLKVAVAATGNTEDLDRGTFNMTVSGTTADNKKFAAVTYRNLTMDERDTVNFIETRINKDKNARIKVAVLGQSRLKTHEYGKAYEVDALEPPVFPLKGGSDGATPRAVDLIGGPASSGGIARGLYAFDVIDDINLVAIPELQNPNVALRGNCRDAMLAATAYCENRGDCFFLIDPPANLGPREVLNFKQGTGSFRGAAFRSSFAALYYPWVVITDPLTGKRKPFPPSAALAGVYAATDIKRGVHKAPAGLQDGALKVAVDVVREVTRGEQEVLNPEGINVIRNFPDGLVVWGARTVSSDPEWRYVNVRRLLLFLEESIDEGTRNLVFEPNDRVLWSQIRANVGSFLRVQWEEGKLVGATAEEAFFVKCDEETNPPESVDLGRVITVIGVAPSKPAEFVIFRISQWRPAA